MLQAFKTYNHDNHTVSPIIASMIRSRLNTEALSPGADPEIFSRGGGGGGTVLTFCEMKEGSPATNCLQRIQGEAVASNFVRGH